MNFKNKFKNIEGKTWFFIIIVVSYFALFFLDCDLFYSSINFFFTILIKIIPVLILVFVLMVLTNYFVTSKIVLKYMNKKGITKWFFVIIAGILSAGPIYMWYPLLADLKNKGLSYGLMACFLYNRAIKIPLLPLMIFYFSLKYVVVLSLVMIFMSVFQGIVINRFMKING